MSDETDAELKRAVLELGIDVPIMRTEHTPQGLVLYLYGGSIVTHNPQHAHTPPNTADRQPATAEPIQEPLGPSLTDLPGIGPATARKLRAAGIFTPRQLTLYTDDELLKILNRPTLAKIRHYFQNADQTPEEA